ncbi:hypothetical protein BCU68_15950 [Vibrio sp. 10N.286.49.B3]|uniref:hypothetical protein n=1 Tax=Vibrio sp. 10N.286.49.B3 TaxID=1880855 RepID=UPI000C842930|nr:hypothetical protein [Vibrio sp. 10N.286.49.B3]PMH40862.1 hypothetical protein BCU68_15950 [Vibrio sp. 10N.286.49.B3]
MNYYSWSSISQLLAFSLLCTSCFTYAAADESPSMNTYQQAHTTDSVIRFRFGGWSHHMTDFPTLVDQDYEYNENHYGVGIDWILPLNDGYFWGPGAHYIKDSYNEDAYAIGLSWGKRWYFGKYTILSAGILAGVQYRGFIDIVDDKIKRQYRGFTPILAPEFTASYRTVGISLIVTPNIMIEDGEKKLQKPTLFFQLFKDF